MSYSNNTNYRAARPNGGRAALLGNGPHVVPPAWRHQPPVESHAAPMGSGSKIFIAGLPLDVERDQIEELMQTTVGALSDTFCVYNKAGKTTGMAVVHFARPGDALKARMLYHNKIIDQRAPIKVDLIVDTTQGFGLPITQPPPPPPPRTLLDRINPSGKAPARVVKQPSAQIQAQPNSAMNIQQQRAMAVQAQAHQQQQPQQHVMPSRQKRKKGPRRLQKNVDPDRFKRQPKTAEDLDKEMEQYNAAAPRQS